MSRRLPQEMEDYIKESKDHSLGLPVVSTVQTLQSKLVASEADRRRLEAESLSLQSKLNQQVRSTQSAKAEARLSAQGLKKAIEKNEQLSEENAGLDEQYKKLKAFLIKCKSALDRAKEDETRVRDLENEVKGLTQDLDFFKNQYQMRKFYFCSMEEILVESFLSDLIGKTESSVVVDEFLLQNMVHDSCRRLLHLSHSLRPSTLRALSLAAKIKTLQNQNQRLQILLSTAQGEAKLLTDQIGYLVEDQRSSYDADEVSSQGQHSRGKPPASKSSSMKLHERTKRPWEPSNSED